MGKKRGLGSPDNVHIAMAREVVRDLGERLDRLRPAAFCNVNVVMSFANKLGQGFAHADSIEGNARMKQSLRTQLIDIEDEFDREANQRCPRKKAG